MFLSKLQQIVRPAKDPRPEPVAPPTVEPAQTPAPPPVQSDQFTKDAEAERLALQLSQKVTELESQYQTMQETKQALVNILEDARQLEAELKTERDRLETIISSVGDGLIVVDEGYRVVLMNPVAEKLLETTFVAAKGQRWDTIAKIFAGDTELPLEKRPLYQVFTLGKTVTGTIDDNYSYQSPSGKKFPISLSNAPLLGPNGKVTGAVSVFRDITHEKEEKNIIEQTVTERTGELRTKNEALQKAQLEISQGWLQAQREKARLTASINSLPIGFILTDKDNAIFMVNSAAKHILGITGDVFHVDALQNLLGNSFKLNDLLSQTKDTKGIIKQNDILLATKYINVMVVPILLDTDNEFLGSAIVVEDITERKITERARDEFFSIASHELRTPLTAIRGNTAMIIQYFAEDLKGNKELTEMISDIHSSSVRLITIVNDFLNVSRLEMKKMTYKKSSFSMKELTEKVHKELETNCTEKHDTLEIHELTNPLPATFADPDRTKEVLLNLIGNAIKYTDNGKVTTDVSVKDNMIYVQITDSGLGIPKERWDLLFRKFQQAGENLYTRDTSRSTGLGLYISKLMIEEMGGKIGLERSDVGKGSTFFFSLPIAT